MARGVERRGEKDGEMEGGLRPGRKREWSEKGRRERAGSGPQSAAGDGLGPELVAGLRGAVRRRCLIAAAACARAGRAPLSHLSGRGVGLRVTTRGDAGAWPETQKRSAAFGTGCRDARAPRPARPASGALLCGLAASLAGPHPAPPQGLQSAFATPGLREPRSSEPDPTWCPRPGFGSSALARAPVRTNPVPGAWAVKTSSNRWPGAGLTVCPVQGGKATASVSSGVSRLLQLLFSQLPPPGPPPRSSTPERTRALH